MKAEEYLSSRYYSFLNGLENKEQIDSVCLAMEEYAKQEKKRGAIVFTKWKDTNYYQHSDLTYSLKKTALTEMPQHYTIEELYQKFKDDGNKVHTER